MTLVTEKLELETLRQCGGCGKYPPFLRRFANPMYFMIAFCMQNILQGASSTYFVGVATSLEKHFHFTSKDIGNLVMLCEIGPITTSLIMSHLGGRGNRPRWLAMGMMISALGLLLAFSTCLIYPPSPLSESGLLADSRKFCELDNKEPNTTDPHNSCYSSNGFVFFMWLVAYSFLGIGSTVVYSIGAPYLDDSIKKNDSPVYFAIIIAVKILGPFVGFTMSAAFLKIYVVPGEDHGISSLDPRWIGAWWGGALLFCILNLIFGIVISLFPRKMTPQEAVKIEPSSVPVDKDFILHEKPSEYGSIQPSNLNVHLKNKLTETPDEIKDDTHTMHSLESISEVLREFLSVVRRLMENKAMMLTVWVDLFAILGITGFFLWLPKYLEHQFRVDKAESALYTGISGTSSVIIGVLGGGIFIRQCRPSAKALVQICATCKGLYIISLIGMMFITCNFNEDLPGTFDPENRILDIRHNCSRECICSRREFIPVCLRDSDTKEKTFFSPCHAGCLHPVAPHVTIQSNQELHNCMCASDEAFVISGYCRKTCSAFTVYNVVNVVIKSFISVGLIGTLLINLRCVDPKDKAAALGLKGTVVALGLLVTPMVFGSLADSSCIVWEEACGRRGSCWVYDTQRFGYKLHSASAILFVASLIFEIILSRNVCHINIMDAIPNSSFGASRTTSNTSVSNMSQASSPMSRRSSSSGKLSFLGNLKRLIVQYLATTEFPDTDAKDTGHEDTRDILETLPEETAESLNRT